MYHIKTLNNIAPKGLAELPAQQFTVNSGAESCVQGILVRSVSMHEAPLPEGLLAVARAGAGVNNIPVPACSEQGIVVFNTPGANANAVMELVLAGLVLASRDVAGGIAWAKTLAGEADAAKQVEKGKSRFAGPELLGKTLGVVGTGRIGKGVIQRASGFQMKVLANDAYPDPAFVEAHNGKYVDLDTLFRESDFITLHAPLTEETRNMVDARRLAEMKPRAVLVNTARGGIVDEDALYQALKEGQIGAAALDATVVEPACGSPLASLPNCILTPHAGAATYEAGYNMGMLAAQNVLDVLSGRECRFLV